MSDNNRSEGAATSLDRRALLRTGGAAVAAGVAGLAVVETVAATSAQAASGDQVLAGRANDAGVDPTSLTSSDATGPTFRVANTGGAAPLNLTAVATPLTVAAFNNGDLVNFDGNLFYTDAFGVGFVYTEATANQIVPITPQRVLDTRTVAGRANIVNSAGNLDGAGRLLANHSIAVSLAGLEIAATAAFCNIAAVSPVSAGFLTLWPGGARPGTSSVNFAAGAVIGNFAVTGTSLTDSVSIYSFATTHLLLDVTAFAVGSPGQIAPTALASPARNATGQRLAARAKAGRLPAWFKPL